MVLQSVNFLSEIEILSKLWFTLGDIITTDNFFTDYTVSYCLTKF